jgi:hypothetical protein
MRSKTLLALSLASAIPLSAQITATLHRLSNGTSEIRVRNDATIPLTTLAISVDFVNRITATPEALVAYVDPVIDKVLPNRNGAPLAAMPLAPQQEITFSPEVLVAVSPLTGKPSFSGLRIAGLFADGTTYGDTGLATRLALRRSNLLSAVDTTLEILADAGRHNVPRSFLIGQFKTVMDALSHWYLPSEQQIPDGDGAGQKHP